MLSYQTTASQKGFMYTGLIGIAALISAGISNTLGTTPQLMASIALTLIAIGVLGYTYSSYAAFRPGIKPGDAGAPEGTRRAHHAD